MIHLQSRNRQQIESKCMDTKAGSSDGVGVGLDSRDWDRHIYTSMYKTAN